MTIYLILLRVFTIYLFVDLVKRFVLTLLGDAGI